MHPNGQIPAYEFALLRREPAGARVGLLARLQDDGPARPARPRCSSRACFQKLLLNFTWWVNRKDVEGKNLFAGGFLGPRQHRRLRPLASRCPRGGHLEQADGTAWMAFYCATMLVDGAGAGAARTRPTRTSPQVLRALRRHRRRDEHARRHRPVGRGGRLLLRPAARRRRRRCRCASARWSGSSRCSPSRCSRTT